MNVQRIDAIKKRIKNQTDHLDQLIAGQYSGECIHDAFRHLQAMYEYLALATDEEEEREQEHDKDYFNDRD